MKLSQKRRSIFLILLGGISVRVLLANFGTLSLDHNTFIAWSNILAEDGFRNFYQGWSDYLPGYLYILWFLGKIRSFLPISEILLFKLPAILADITTGFLIYKIVSKIRNEKWGIVVASLYVFNPAILANSTLWGQVDSLTALFSLLAIYLFSANIYLSAIVLSIGTLVKPQAAFVAPIILFLFLKNRVAVKKILVYGTLGLAVFILGFLPFAGGENLVQFIIGRLNVSFNQYPYTSINAFNFWGLLGFWKPDGGFFGPKVIGLAAITAVLVFSWILLWRKKQSEYLYAAVIFLTTFLFLTRMHERHLLPALPFLAIAGVLNPAIWVSYFLASVGYLANLYYSYRWISEDFLSVFSPFVVKVLILLSLASLGITLLAIWRENIFKKFLRWDFVKSFNFKTAAGSFPTETLSKISIPKKWVRALLFLVISFSFVTRFAWLGSPPHEYFDEVYHAFTARQILHGNPAAWEWWNTPPSGLAYEWTHPPLAKLGMVVGMLIFGENSFGWRAPGAALGVGAVILIYLIAKELFKDELLGILSAAVFSLDGLPLVASRIGMNDTFFLFFALLSIYLFIRDKYFFSAFAFGLSAASKWSAIWTIPIFVVMFFVLKKRLGPAQLWFLVLPPLVYFASYTPMFLVGNHTIQTFIDVQKQMWWYHTRLKATHPYTSPWWSWPFLKRPIYLYTSDEAGGTVARIYAMGNPVIFWFGLASVLACLFYAFKKRSKRLALIIFSYFVFFVPWAASPRIMFLYHYLPSLPFLAMATGYIIRKNLKLGIGLLGIALAVFIYFYPHLAGLRIPLSLDTSYYWFSSWR